VLDELRSERVDSVLDDPEVDQVVTRRLGASTGLWVPLVARGKPIGVLVAHDKLGVPDGRFSDDDLRLAETFASRAAVAVDLSERVARDALRRVVAAQELERRRLARELHDETGQALASILLGLRGLDQHSDPAETREAIARIRELAVGTLRDVRQLAVDLHPKALDDFGLVAALERLIETWGSQTGIAVDFAARLGDASVSDDAATAIYRIVQEALTNVVKHAAARHVSILLTRQNERVVAVIEDDGLGFDPGRESDGSGIHGMRERIQLLDGRLRIESGSGSGTTLVVEVPDT
jgi:signal transduction histidine kinase